MEVKLYEQGAERAARTVSFEPAGTVVWKADAEAPLAQEWASNSSVPLAVSPPAPDPTRISQSTFRAQGTRSYRFELRPGDDSFGSRCELGDALPSIPAYQTKWFRAGEERWIAFQVFLPTDWPADPGPWQTIMQIKPVSPGGGGPNIGLDAGRNRLSFYGNSNVWGSAQGNIFDGAGPLIAGSYPLTRGQWIKLTYHVVFATSAAGAVEVFGDLADGQGMRTLVPRRNRPTMKLNGTVQDPSHMRIGIYRDPSMTVTQHCFFDGVTVASSRAAAEANAYGA